MTVVDRTILTSTVTVCASWGRGGNYTSRREYSSPQCTACASWGKGGNYASRGEYSFHTVQPMLVGGGEIIIPAGESTHLHSEQLGWRGNYASRGEHSPPHSLC